MPRPKKMFEPLPGHQVKGKEVFFPCTRCGADGSIGLQSYKDALRTLKREFFCKVCRKENFNNSYFRRSMPFITKNHGPS